MDAARRRRDPLFAAESRAELRDDGDGAQALCAMHGKVLYIEDEPVYLELIEAMLADAPGITLVKTSSGRQGVELAHAEQPDVILLDLHLPDISGLEVVRSLSELIARRRLRVILITGDSFSIDIVKAMSLGAHEYWVKPITLDRLRSGLARALRR